MNEAAPPSQFGIRPIIAVIILVGLVLGFGLQYGSRSTVGTERRTVRPRALPTDATLAALRTELDNAYEEICAAALARGRVIAAGASGDVEDMRADLQAMDPAEIQIVWSEETIASEALLAWPADQSDFGAAVKSRLPRLASGRTFHATVRLSDRPAEDPDATTTGDRFGVWVEWHSAEPGAVFLAAGLADALAEQVERHFTEAASPPPPTD